MPHRPRSHYVVAVTLAVGCTGDSSPGRGVEDPGAATGAPDDAGEPFTRLPDPLAIPDPSPAEALAVPSQPPWPGEERPFLQTLFADHMVLQRHVRAPIWGWTDPGARVSVEIAGHGARAVADANGRWMAVLEALPAGGPYVLTVSGSERRTVSDVLIGDVWIAAGQSNMELRLSDPDELARADFPAIRQLKLIPAASGRNVDVARTASPPWTVCDPSHAGQFSAVAYYFARRIHSETGVPIGILNATYGGSSIEAWMPPWAPAEAPELGYMVEAYRRRVDAYYAALEAKRPAGIDGWLAEARAELSTTNASPIFPDDTPGPVWNAGDAEATTPFALHGGMVHATLPYAIRGSLWYQGETNGGDGDIYAAKTGALVRAWRKLRAQGETPFYFVQLPAFQPDQQQPAGGDGWSRLREGQLLATSIPSSGMAVTIDVGAPDELHPPQKIDVGERLALIALAKDYAGELHPGGGDRAPLAPTESTGPVFESSTVEAGRIRVTFDHVGRGLIIGSPKRPGVPVAADPMGKLARFAIAGDDRAWRWADAVIEGDTVVVSSREVPEPRFVRYAFSASPLGANLYNADGLPASPFRTDEDHLLVARGATGGGVFLPGMHVTVRAQPAPAGQVFDRWLGGAGFLSDATRDEVTVTMPSRDLVLVAAYRSKE